MVVLEYVEINTINPHLSVTKYPLSKIENIFTQLSCGILFSKINLSEAYAKLELNKDSKIAEF